MTLVIDLGHTRCKWAWSAQPGRLQHPGSATRLEPLLETLRQSRRPGRILIADVRADLMAKRLIKAVADLGWPTPQRVQTPIIPSGLTLAYQQPATLGVDRFLSLLAIASERPGAAIIVDAGSALTIDATDAHRRHLGGVILPGWKTLADALRHISSRLPVTVTPPQQQPRPWGKTSAECVRNGQLYAWSVSALQVVSEMRKTLGSQTPVVTTGGDGAALLPSIPPPAELDETLVLRGLTWLQAD